MNAKDNRCHELRMLEDDEFKRHLEMCAECQAWEEQMSRMLDLTATIPDVDVPDSLTRSVMRSIEAEQEAKENVGRMILPVLTFVSIASFCTSEGRISISNGWSWAAAAGLLYVFYLLFIQSDTQPQAVYNDD